MKAKRFVLMCLFVLILFSVSAVSASGNVTDEVSAIQDGLEEISVSEDAADEVSASNETEEELAASEDDLLGFGITVPDEFFIIDKLYEDGDRDVVGIYSSKELSGNISVSIDGKECFNKDIKSCYDEDDDEYGHYYGIKQKDLPALLKIGERCMRNA